MTRFRSADSPFRPGPKQRSFITFHLIDRLRLQEPFDDTLTHQRRHAVIAQTAGMDRLRNERMSERVHGKQRGHACHIAKIVGKRTARQCGAGRRFHGNNFDLCSVDFFAHKGKRNAGKITAAPRTSDHNIRILDTCHF